MWSPPKNPPFRTSIVAVMIFPSTVGRLPSAAMEPPASVTVLTERTPYSVPDAPLLLIWLAKLVSLGDGLRGLMLSSGLPFAGSDLEADLDPSVALVA